MIHSKKFLMIGGMLFSMVGFTSVSALTNSDFGYANGIIHGSRIPSSYDTFTFRDSIYSASSGLYDCTTASSHRYSGSYAQNLSNSYVFTAVSTKTAGKEVTVTNRMNSNQFKTHWHYGRDY